MNQILIHPDKIVFDVGINEHHLNEVIKQIPDRNFDVGLRKWVIPINRKGYALHISNKFNIQCVEIQPAPKIDYSITDELPDLTIDIPLKMTLRDYQRKGVAYMMLHKRVINGDDMGLGKTGQSIAAIEGLKAFPCLVICPAGVKLNWLNQWFMWTGKKRCLILDKTNARNWHLYYESGMIDVFICNYDALKSLFVTHIDNSHKQLLLKHITFDSRIQDFESIVIDELHNCKDKDVMRSKLVKGLTTGKEIVFGLTGTPVVNNAVDTITMVSIINQLPKIGGYEYAMKEFAQGKRKASNLDKLNYLLKKSCFVRRLKTEVAKELPPLTREIIEVEITNQKEYDRANEDLIGYLRVFKNASDEKLANAERGKIMVQIQTLKRISAFGKMEAVIEYINELKDSNEKCVVFGDLKEIIYDLAGKFKHSVVITGDQNIQNRQESIRKFQETKECMQVFCGIKAAGTGVDGLQKACTNIVHYELPWTSSLLEQADSRVDRIGKIGPTTSAIFMGKKTIDWHIWEIIQNKKDIADQVTGDKEQSNSETSVFNALINKLSEKL